MTPQRAPVTRRSFTRVWRHHEYRALLVVMVLLGMAVSSYVPLVSLFLVQVLGVSDADVGLFSLTLLAAPVVGIVLGRLSDRLPGRTTLFLVVALWVALGRVAMGSATTFGAAITVGIVFGAFAGVLSSLVFAILKDVLEREQEGQQATVSSAVRTGYSLGWVLGPVLGSALAAVLGLRGALAASGLLVLLTLAPLRVLSARDGGAVDQGDRPGSAVTTADEGGGGGRRGGRGRQGWGSTPLWLFALTCLLALTGESMRLTYLPVLAVDRLGLSLVLFGALVAVAPAVELVMMPTAGALADRYGLKPVLVAGLALGALASFTFARSTGVASLLVGQLLNACFIAVVLGLGVAFAQSLDPAGAGFAASVFFAAQSLSVVTAGATGALAASSLGLPAMFYAPALLCAGAGVLLLTMRTSRAETAT